jgi:antitoxin ParD1/3/4
MAGGVEKISISLTPDLVAILQEAVEKDGYASTSEVVREALRDWRAKRIAKQQAIEEVRRLWDEGIASGRSGFHSVEEIIADARARKARN